MKNFCDYNRLTFDRTEMHLILDRVNQLSFLRMLLPVQLHSILKEELNFAIVLAQSTVSTSISKLLKGIISNLR